MGILARALINPESKSRRGIVWCRYARLFVCDARQGVFDAIGGFSRTKVSSRWLGHADARQVSDLPEYDHLKPKRSMTAKGSSPAAIECAGSETPRVGLRPLRQVADLPRISMAEPYARKPVQPQANLPPASRRCKSIHRIAVEHGRLPRVAIPLSVRVP
jgi:hypothetical protein